MSATLKMMQKNKEAAATEVDVLMAVASEVENLSPESAFEEVSRLSDDIEMNSFRLGGVLSVIRTHKWFGEYGNFKDLVAGQFGLHYRKAMHLVEIYEALMEHQIPWDKVKSLGWTKLRELARVLSAENVDYWVAQASNMTVVQLVEAVKNYQKIGQGGGMDEDGTPITSTVTTLTLKVHEDQKSVIKQAIEKAKEEAGTEVDTVAMERICQAYLGGTFVVASPAQSVQGFSSLKEAMQSVDYIQVLTVFEELWPNINLTAEE